jgi:predicted amidophosphoribosyltransferase
LKEERMIGEPLVPFSKHVVAKMTAARNTLPFRTFFGSEVALIPVPKSSLHIEGGIWISSLIAQEMSAQGWGQYYPVLKRVRAVRKSATAPSDKRPKAKEHFETILCESRPDVPERIVLIDDVITRGATVLGCASKVKQHFPQTPVVVFCVMRTVTNPAEFKTVEDPCTGWVRLTGEETYREP